jgi:ISXO2-like transposase domain/Transposase zinc-ribbon domain
LQLAVSIRFIAYLNIYYTVLFFYYKRCFETNKITNMFTNLRELISSMPDEQTCRNYLAKQRWNDKPVCPYCNCNTTYVIEKGKRFKCGNPECYKKFSVITGTFFEASKLALTKWLPAVYFITAHKKGISSYQLAKNIGTSQKTAWFMLHRIRKALQYNSNELLTGIVEVDETYMAKKYRSKYQGLSPQMVETIEREGMKKHTRDKGAVIGIKQRDGNIVVKGANKATANAIFENVEQNTTKDIQLMTDESTKYVNVFKNYNRQSVNHSRGEFVRGIVHTNGVENFWSVMKRGVHGTYHQISYKHLQQYCNEFSYRYNSRKLKDAARFELTLQSIEGRLTYKQLVYGETNQKENSKKG